MLASSARLRRREDFTATVRTGRRATRGVLVVHLILPPEQPDPARTDQPSARAGFVVSKAVGGAVIRNTVKRRLRHLARTELAALPAGADVVVRALPGAATRSYTQLEIDLREGIAAAIRRGGRR